MILTDTGPLVALIDLDETDHKRCAKALAKLQGPMLTTWPAFTEAMYLLGAHGGWQGQEKLWRIYLRGNLVVEMPKNTERAAELMRRYCDLPMDLADATLVALAEERGLITVFSLDKDFRIYRLGRKHFTVVPE